MFRVGVRVLDQSGCDGNAIGVTNHLFLYEQVVITTVPIAASLTAVQLPTNSVLINQIIR